ncbi:MAG TPA: hypothetical protein VGD60_10460 [Candidatus Acidoferrales bacterium]
MKIFSLAAGLLVVCPAVGLLYSAPRAQVADPPKIIEFKERVPMTTGEIRKGDVCASFFPELESDEFFNGLQRVESDTFRAYRKFDRPVFTYPSHLTIQIDVRILLCDADVYTPAPTPDFMKTLHYKLQWKHDLYLRPVLNYLVQSVPLNLPEGGENRRLLVVQIRDAGSIPITDHLILTILSPEGKILTRMAAKI